MFAKIGALVFCTLVATASAAGTTGTAVTGPSASSVNPDWPGNLASSSSPLSIIISGALPTGSAVVIASGALPSSSGAVVIASGALQSSSGAVIATLSGSVVGPIGTNPPSTGSLVPASSVASTLPSSTPSTVATNHANVLNAANLGAGAVIVVAVGMAVLF